MPKSGDGNEIQYLNPFRDTVELYRNSWWRGTVPLPHKAKHPPPTGFTGHRAPYPTDEEIKAWCEDSKRHNIGLRLAGVDKQYEILGIDVDHYVSGEKDKKGGDQLKELEQTLGKLPDTWISSARTDGISGIRYFRVPRGLAFRGQVAKDIECISKGYRFAVVWPSIHPDGGRYWWFPPGVVPEKSVRLLWDGTLPDARKLPLLPETWLNYLNQDGMRAKDDERIDMDSSPSEIQQWADDTFHGDDDDEPCSTFRNKLDKQRKDIASEATSHDKIVKAHYNLVRLAAEGHIGFAAAIREINQFWAEDVIKRDKRDPDELRNEIWRSLMNALRKVKGQIDERVKIGAEPIDQRCDESGMCGSKAGASSRDDSDGDGPSDPIDTVPRGAVGACDSYEMNDDGNAEHLRDMFSPVAGGASFRWVEGYGFIVWHEGDNPHWERDELSNQEIRRMWYKVKASQYVFAENLFNQYQNDLQAEQNNPNTTVLTRNNTPATGTVLAAQRDLAKRWQAFAEQSGMNRSAENALKAVRSMAGIALDINELDQNPLLLGVANGVIQLDREEVRLRRAQPEDFVTLNTGVPWEQPTKLAQEIWDEYLETVLPDEELRRTTKVILGHILVGGNPDNKLIVLKGQPRTGKSTMVDAILAALGDYAASVNHSIFQNHKLNPVLADSLHMRAIVCSEFGDDDDLSISMLKRMTGEDKIRAELKGSNAKVEGYPQFVPILPTNDVPKIKGADKALRNRLVVIPFCHRPQKIKTEIKRLIKTTCRVAVLNWLVEGYAEYLRIGELPTCKAIEDETNEFASELDEVATFAYESLQQHSHMESNTVRWQDAQDWCVQSGKMYERFETWWMDNKLPDRERPSIIKFARRMKSLGYRCEQKRFGGSQGKFWVGVKIKPRERTVIPGNFNPGAITPVVSSSTRNKDPN